MAKNECQLPQDHWQYLITALSAALDVGDNEGFDEACENVDIASLGIEALPSEVLEFLLRLLEDPRFLALDRKASFFVTLRQAMAFTLTGNQRLNVRDTIVKVFQNVRGDSITAYLIREILVDYYSNDEILSTIAQLYSPSASIEQRRSLARGLRHFVDRRIADNWVQKALGIAATIAQDGIEDVRCLATSCLHDLHCHNREIRDRQR